MRNWELLLAGLAGFIAGMMLNMIVPIGVRKTKIFPTPANANSLLYQDAAGVCFRAEVDDAECIPGAQPIPVQA
jgi:hypothetical protein